MTAISARPSERDRLRHAAPTTIYCRTTLRKMQGAASIGINRADAAKFTVIGRHSLLAEASAPYHRAAKRADRTIQRP